MNLATTFNNGLKQTWKSSVSIYLYLKKNEHMIWKAAIYNTPIHIRPRLRDTLKRSEYCKITKYSDTRKFAVIILKFDQYGSTIWAASSKFGTYRLCEPEPPLLAHTSSESRGTFRQKPRSLAPLNGWTCAVKICHDKMLEDTNSLDMPHIE